jgi:hypothetical protein
MMGTNCPKYDNMSACLNHVNPQIPTYYHDYRRFEAAKTGIVKPWKRLDRVNGSPDIEQALIVSIYEMENFKSQDFGDNYGGNRLDFDIIF